MSNEKIIFSMYRVGKKTPTGKQILKNINLSFFYGAKIGIIGLNGSGKSTLLKMIAGLDEAYEGDIVFPKEHSTGYLPQEPELDVSKTVKEIVSEGVQDLVDVMKEYEEVNLKFAEPMSDDEMNSLITRQGELMGIIDQRNGWELDNMLNRAMQALKCPPAEKSVANLSGGERRRIALCRLLLQDPDILLLDEPTNHLDATSIHWLQQHLEQYKGTVICITHDRYFLDNVAKWILELDRGEGIPWKGNYEEWLVQKTKLLEMEEKHESKRRKTLERELEWVRMSPKARHAKSQARLNSYDKMMNANTKQQIEKLQIYVPNGPRLGDKVIEFKKVAKSFDGRMLFSDLDFTLPPAGIVGVIGPNGSGKTTLFRLIMGQEKADTGNITIGSTVKIGYVDQAHEAIDPEKTVYEVVSGGLDNVIVDNKEINARGYIGRFNFTGSDQEKKCGILSGGERNRLHLALTLKENANVLLLDEPTNDIDVNTLQAMEEGLENFAGCAVVISHDRWFLDRVATHILAFEGDGQVYFYEGGYSDYETHFRKRTGNDIYNKVRYVKIKE